ncbi:MAG: hypothetical protein CM15mP49_28730 [Actinomycetota bacterium]|nr:MAG: hypothetical protein CM15mP49_28730 [Actinomycetota bacterium]
MDHSRQEIIQRLINLMMEASDSGADLVVYPELALTTFFPRWFIEEEDSLNLDDFYETEMPNSSTQILFETAKKLKIGFSLGYAELTKDGHRYNTQVLVGKKMATSSGSIGKCIYQVMKNMNLGENSST